MDFLPHRLIELSYFQKSISDPEKEIVFIRITTNKEILLSHLGRAFYL